MSLQAEKDKLSSKIYPHLNALPEPLTAEYLLSLLEFSLYLLSHCRIPANLFAEPSEGEGGSEQKKNFFNAGKFSGEWPVPSTTTFAQSVRTTLESLLAPDSDQKYTFANGNKFIGECVLGVPNGYGTIEGEKDSQFVGFIYNGKRESEGTQNYPNGDSYEGTFADDMRSGFGRYTRQDNGAEAEGSFLNDQMHGCFFTTYKKDGGNKYNTQFSKYSTGVPTGQRVWIDGDLKNIVYTETKEGSQKKVAIKFKATQEAA